jgi:dTDP-4-dehydrorhamnose 3,5-epimerase
MPNIINSLIMQIFSTTLPDLKIIQLKIYHDDRGFFVERFNQKTFADLGLPTQYWQDNHSFSLPNVIRGLHYQQNPSQIKLVSCISGSILDVAVDIRKNSPTFGKHFAIELNSQDGKMLYIPAGFAHGFCVLGKQPANVLYKVNNPYSASGDGGIRFDDPILNISWPINNPHQPIISSKDLSLPTFLQYQNSNNTF